MRLCFLGHASNPLVRRWVSWFAERGHEVTLLTYRPAEIPGVEVVDVLPRGVGGWRLQWRIVRRVRELLAERRPDLLHAHYITEYGWYGALSGFHPFVLTGWGSDVFIDPARKWTWGRLYRKALRAADLLLTQGETCAEAMVRGGAPRERIRLVHWGVDRERFRPGVDASALRARWGIGPGPVVLSPRTFTPLYNIDRIVLAVPEVARAAPEVTFVFKDNPAVSNDPAYAERLRALAREIGAEPHSRWPGPIGEEDLPAMYAMADVTVSTPASDNIAVTLLEAVACGSVPVIGEAPAPREWYRDGVHALYAKNGDPASIARCVLRLLGDPALRARMRAAGQALVAERGDREAHMRRAAELYRSLIFSVPKSET
jgi:glycosyltransferase involved in cell wall biosynthesis